MIQWFIHQIKKLWVETESEKIGIKWAGGLAPIESFKPKQKIKLDQAL